MQDTLHVLVPVVRFKKREKKNMQECSFSKVTSFIIQFYWK